MHSGTNEPGSHHFANPVQEVGFYRERLVTTLAVAIAIVLIEPLGPHRFAFTIGFVLIQVTSTFAARGRFESPADALGVFLAIEFALSIVAPILMPAGWAPALVIAMYSVGVNAGFLTRRWLYVITGLCLGGFSFTALLLRPGGAGPLLVIAFILSVHAVTKRGSSVVSAELAYGEMRNLQILATRAAADAQWLASHDSLTGLSNRRALTDMLDEHSREKRPVGIMLLDLDGFKAVNDDYGHHYGDLMLAEIATRLLSVMNDESAALGGIEPVVARLGGDEFAVLSSGATMESLNQLAAVTMKSLSRYAVLEEISVPVRVSVGLATATGHETANLLHHADIAMYEAKRNGGGIARFDPLISPSAMPGRRTIRSASDASLQLF